MLRLRSRPDYLAAAKGIRIVRPGFVLQARRRNEPTGAARFGFTATRKLGGAVTRNRVRRRLKAIASIAAPTAPEGHDLVLIGRRGAINRDFAAMVSELGSALEQAARSEPDIRRRSN